jgi:ABC-type cobalt transport system substrate-binding protein
MNDTATRMMLEWGVMFAVAIIATLLLLSFAKKQAARFGGKGGKSYGEVIEEQTAEMKRLNDYLEKSGAVNEQRFLSIETRLAELEKRVT